jgi:small GTP-binding protein
LNIKVVFIGNLAVGKITIINYQTTQKFSKKYPVIVGGCVRDVLLEVNSKQIILNGWDTAGQETYRNLVLMCSRDVLLVVIVFSLSDKNDFLTYQNGTN